MITFWAMFLSVFFVVFITFLLFIIVKGLRELLEFWT